MSDVYEIRVRGDCRKPLLHGFGDMTVTTETVLRGRVADQAELHGLLAMIRDLGVDLIDVRTVGQADGPPGRST